MKSSRTYWLCQTLGWGVYAVVNAYGVISILRLPVLPVLRDNLIPCAIGLLATHVLRRLATRHKWSDLPVRALLARAIVASIALGVPLGTISLLMPTVPLQVSDFVHANAGDLSTLFIQWGNWSILVAVWQCLYFGTLIFRARHLAQLRQSELTRALQLAELRALKSQINPHFLFNALNTVRALIAEDPKKAQEAVTRLAGTLRYALGASQTECVTLERELATVNDYLTLESLRFEDRLTVERTIADDVLTWNVPVMLIQTLVENAIKHGVAARTDPSVVEILAQLSGGKLSVEVRNPRARAARLTGQTGVGLQNARERLRLMFGGEAALDLDLSDPERAVARVTVPRSLADA
jgi:hypothetical protein